MQNYKITENKILRISQDTDAQDPRKEWDNLGTIHIGDNRYFRGDIKLDWDNFDPSDYAICLNVYAYIHSGIVLSCSPFDCKWDSGQSGFITITKDQLISEYGADNEETRKNATDCLIGEIETFSQYLGGSVYGFELIELRRCSGGHDHEYVLDSCWGFYGDNPIENGMFDHWDDETQSQFKELTK